MENTIIKSPKTKTAVHPLILKRRSPLAFSDKPISTEQLTELFEAASWAASAFNEQPWRYVYSVKGTEG
ncbi:MAG: nitroreductase family protein, partial [Bacteroidota bacterium]